MEKPSASSRTLRVFVVENHRDTRQAIVEYLEAVGHIVSSAGTVEDALATLGSTPCDVLLCDIGLPDGDGWELLREAKLDRPVYAIAMSGFGMDTDRLKSEAAGYRAHILKPFAVGDLDAHLETAAREICEAPTAER